MDPYLERHWRDVHTALISYTRDTLNAQLPEDLIARAEERMAIEVETSGDGSNQRRSFSPDVRVFAAVENLGATGANGGGTALAPYRLTLLDEPLTERFVEIIDVRGGERVVTVIEFTSPTNKTTGMSAFIEKRNELMQGGVNMVEIDLVREGDWRRLLGYPCPPAAVSEYRAVMRVAETPTEVYLHPIALREPLPTIKIPLRHGEPPCELPLQPLIEQAYRNGRYERTINYGRPCEPALSGDDAAWAKGLLRP